MDTQKKSYEHQGAFDYLRILGALGVVFIHVTSIYLGICEVSSSGFAIANFINVLTRFSVPVFVMISGAVFLSEKRELSIGLLWRRYIPRLMILYMVWSLLYYMVQCIFYWKYDFWNHGIVSIINGCVYASNHFWFLFMLMGLYVLVPVLRLITRHATDRELYYFGVIFFVFQIVRVTFTELLQKSLVDKLSDLLQITELSWYLGYFILGYTLVHRPIPVWFKRLAYGITPIGLLCNFWISQRASLAMGQYTPGIYDSFGIFTFFYAITMFMLFTDRIPKSRALGSGSILGALAKELGADTLGIYLMHLIWIGLAQNTGIMEYFPGTLTGTLTGALTLGLGSFFLSAAIAALLRRIPLIGRYLC